MDTQKFTNKSLDAIQEAQKIAIQNDNLQIEQAHLVQALLEQHDGLIPQLLKKMGVDTNDFLASVQEKVKSLPGVTGPGRNPEKSIFRQAWTQYW